MKKKLFLTLVLILVGVLSFSALSKCYNRSDYDDISTQSFLDNKSNQNINLENIEKRAIDSLTVSIIQKSIKPLDRIYKEFTKAKSPIENYWKAYISYQKAIYGLVKLQQEVLSDDKTIIKENVEQGIETLKNTAKSSESYALLATLTSLSIDYQTNLKKMVVVGDTKKYFKKALELNAKNLRAHLGLARLDYYTPKKFGGKKEVTKILEDALACDDQTIKSPIMPSWGRIDVYELIIKHNVEERNMEVAKKYFREATEKYPNEYRINMLAKLFV